MWNDALMHREGLKGLGCVNPFTPKRDFSRFHFTLLAVQIAIIMNEMCVLTSKFGMFGSQI